MNCRLLLAAIALLLGASAIVESAVAETDLASIVRGGRLYDNWYLETKEPVPPVPHPAYPAEGRHAEDPAASWRCKECHGWDYKGSAGAYGQGDHFTGIKGIAAMGGAEPAEIVAILKDETHRYGGLLDEEDFRDLANFVRQGQIDMDRHIDAETKSVKGDATRAEVYFTTICANCHGKDGQKFWTKPSLGRVARSNPWEALHKILNGHPGENMPALRVFDIDILVGILAYIQGLPTEEILASVVRGGRLYDDWVREAERPAPREVHPAYPAAAGQPGSPGATWLCRACHGWDYKGSAGADRQADHFTGIKGIAAMAGAASADIVAILKDETHRYGDLMADQDLHDLANFVSKGQIDMDRHIDRTTKAARGDKDHHRAYYATICATCHGQDGRKITTMVPLGQVARLNPWNALHKMLNGHPAEEMPALRVLDMEVLIDNLAYIQALPAR